VKTEYKMLQVKIEPFRAILDRQSKQQTDAQLINSDTVRH